jgi:NitT/TauT family transport system ATP-binding protein
MKLIGFAKSYGKTRVFENLNLEIADGEILAIVGPSGCGKTTLLNGIAGLISHGGVIEGKPERVGYIFQEPRLLLNLTVRENL